MQSSVVIQEAFYNAYRDDFEESLQKAIKSLGINVTRQLSDTDKMLISEFADGEMDYYRFVVLVKYFGEKDIILNCFGGYRPEFNAYGKALKSQWEDWNKADRGENPRYLSVEEGKLLQDHEHGDHAPTHSTHFNKGLGSDAGFVGTNNHGYVWQCFVDGYLRQIDMNGAKALIKQRYDRIISDADATELADQLNKDRRIFEAKMLQGEIGDSPTTKDAISIITNKGKQKALSFEKTNILGMEARKNCHVFEHEAGKIIGHAIIDGNSEELNSKTAKLCLNLIEDTNQNVENVISIITNMFKKSHRTKDQ